MEKQKDLVLFIKAKDQEKLMEVFKAEKGLEPVIAEIESIVSGFEYDVETKKGQDAIRSLASNVAKSKVLLDDLGKSLTEKQRLEVSLVNNNRREMKERLDKLKIKAREPLTNIETAQKERAAKHESGIDRIKSFLELTDSAKSEDLKESLTVLESIDVSPENFEEYSDRAGMTKNRAVTYLNEIIDKRIKYETDQAELARLKAEDVQRKIKERDDEIARAAADKAKKEAEEKAEKEKRDAENQRLKAEAEKQAEIDKAERLKIKAEQEKQEAIANTERLEKEKIERETARVAREKQVKEQRKQDAIEAERKQKQAIEDDRKKREQADKEKKEREEKEEQERLANKKHIDSIVTKAEMSLERVLENYFNEFEANSDKMSEVIIKAIRDNEIENVTINF